MTARHHGPQPKLSAAITLWWRTRHEANARIHAPLPADLAVDDTVRQTGLRGRGRRMTITAIKGASARCTWTHDGDIHADWFAVSGLRRAPA